MVPLLQSFAFSYEDGPLFYDRSGLVSFQLQQLIQGLRIKDSQIDQRKLSSPAEEIDLFFGIRVSRIQCFSPDQPAFASVAARFLEIVTRSLQVDTLSEFQFRRILGKPCSSVEEAQTFLAPLFPDETKEKLKELAEPSAWRAAQFDFLVGSFSVEARLAMTELVPHQKFAVEGIDPSVPMPHVTVELNMRGLAPISVEEFDAEAFIGNVCKSHTDEVFSKLAPHLTPE